MNPTATPTAQRATSPSVTLLESLTDAVLVIDERGAIGYANPAAAALFGFSVAELRGRPLAGVLADPYGSQYRTLLDSLARGEVPAELTKPREIVGKRRDGSGIAIELSLSEVREGQSRSLVAVARDIRERKRAEAQLRRLADHDSLTGLINRPSFEAALTRHVDYADRYGSGGSVIALGVDTFQYVNESLGAAAGDELLIGIAESISGRLRRTDVFARIGGDVFALLVHGTDRTKALALADELLGIIRRRAFVLAGEGIRVTMSAGVTSLDDRKLTGAELLGEAEAAMHTAKEAGRDRVAAFDPKGRGEADERRAWSERVRQATERGLFVLVSQPIVDLRGRGTTQHEILLRMRRDGGGLVEPGEFLATAERFGLIGQVDRWVTQQAVRLIEQQNREGRELTLEVNLSGKTMGDARFPDEVKKELDRSRRDRPGVIARQLRTATG